MSSQKINKFFKHETLRIFSIFSIFIFAILPLFSLFFTITNNDLSFVFNDLRFLHSILNSLFISTISSVLTTLLSLVCAYFLSESNIRHKKVIVFFLTLGMLVPTISIGLGFRALFGTNGFIDKIFGVDYDGTGYFGLIVGSMVACFPTNFLIVYDALTYEDKGPYDAAEVMGLSKSSTFFKVTLPYLKGTLFSAFLSTLTLIFSDYGIPMELAGKVDTLPIYLYNQIMTSFNYGRGSIAGLVLLTPAILSLMFDVFNKESKIGEAKRKLVPSSNKFNVVTIIIIVLVALFMFVPQMSFITLTFTKSYPNDLSFTFNNLSKLFTDKYGLGLLHYIGNSLSIAILTAIFGTILAFVFGYLSIRHAGKNMSKVLDVSIAASMAIPGIVLGIGYMFLFRYSAGFFYGTMTILVVANIMHFIGSPYLMAKNCLSKLNSDYEVIGETIGISKLRIFFRVLVPNSRQTIVQMFSYFFINSMITISAVSFLCTYVNEPLAILITMYEKDGNYEMQAAISFVILLLNITFKLLVGVIIYLMNRRTIKGEDLYMKLNRYEFELLTFLEKNGEDKYTQRFLSDTLTLSLGTVNKLVKDLTNEGYITKDINGNLMITEEGLKALEPYKVKKAIIIAAGFGSRLAPVTLDTPKPLVEVNGVRIIDSLLDALVDKGITNIIIVRGYKKEKFDVLLEKYPFIRFVDNEEFNVTNNISSVYKIKDYIDRCYICEADLLVSNPDLIRKYEYSTNYLGAKVKETDDWCFKKVNGIATKYQQGGEDCYQCYGISYWSFDDSIKLQKDVDKVYHSRGGKDLFWDAVIFNKCRKNYKIEVRPCHKSDIIEIDNFSELVAIDPSYSNYPGHDQF